MKFGQSMFESGEANQELQCGCPDDQHLQYSSQHGCLWNWVANCYRGCCIGLVNPNYKDAIKATVDRLYLAQFPQYKDTYRVTFCKTDDGARIVDLPEMIDQEANL